MKGEQLLPETSAEFTLETPEVLVENGTREKDGIIAGLWERGKAGISRTLAVAEKAIGRPLDRRLAFDIAAALEEELYQHGSGGSSEAIERVKAVAQAALPPEKSAIISQAIDRAGKLAADLRELSAMAAQSLEGLKSNAGNN